MRGSCLEPMFEALADVSVATSVEKSLHALLGDEDWRVLAQSASGNLPSSGEDADAAYPWMPAAKLVELFLQAKESWDFTLQMRLLRAMSLLARAPANAVALGDAFGEALRSEEDDGSKGSFAESVMEYIDMRSLESAPEKPMTEEEKEAAAKAEEEAAAAAAAAAAALQAEEEEGK